MSQSGSEQVSTTQRSIDRAVPWRGIVTITGFAISPFAAFLVANRAEGLAPGELVPYASVLAAAGVLVVLITWVASSSELADRLAIALAAGLFAVVNYGPFSELLTPLDLRVRYELIVWGLLLVGLVSAAWIGSRRPAVRTWVLVSAVLLAVVPAAQVALQPDTTRDRSVSTGAAVGGLERTPSIYYVVPDAYGRADLLRAGFDFDNSDFLESLEARGFVVADRAYANFSNTYLSVPSTLQMDYVVEPGPEALEVHADGQSFDRTRFYEIIRGASPLVEVLRDAGYLQVHAPPGTWSGSECSGNEDLCVEPISRSDAGMVLGELEWSLLQLTPAATLLASLGETFDDANSDPAHVVQQVASELPDAPVFALIHMMHAHPPFRFDAGCGAIDAGQRSLTRWDEDARGAYVEGIQCANRRIEAMLDLLPEDAIVVIQADHGPNFLRGTNTPVHEWSDQQIEERLAVLSAVRLPEDCRHLVDDELAGVNTFRVVLACITGGEVDLLPTRHFVAPDRGDPEVREVERPGAVS